MAILIWASVLMGAPNPILEGVADAGVLRFGAKYYLMGVGTAGGAYVSDDLVHWSGPEHVFSMENAWTSGSTATDDNIHACDWVLLNGTFHLYWSVNNGKLRQIGHAVAETPAARYHEPKRDAPFDGRIDPQCFEDEDGSLYFYTVKFGMGNAIYGQPLSSPWELKGEPKALLTARPGTWETLDVPKTLVNEGPFVSRYRGRYYLIYNANHTGGNYGHYALGVAEADAPLAFSNESKYAFPVLRSNRDVKYEGVEAASGDVEVKNCGQPNLVRGPNGIEWWLVYFADQARRSQCIDRVHFLGRELYIEGPTTSAAPGYHPCPTMPSFRDLFDGNEPPAAQWEIEGPWTKSGGALHVAAKDQPASARPRIAPPRSYVLETALTCADRGTGESGVVAWDDERGSSLRIGIDYREGVAFCTLRRHDGDKTERVSLAEGFNADGPHALRIENNEGAFRILLDGILLPFRKARLTDYAPGRVGLFASACSASFESFTLTRGWDEWGCAVRGWKNAKGKERSATAKGITVKAGSTFLKGEPLAQYEFATQIRGEGGIYPVHTGEDNWLRISVDADFTQLRVAGKRSGKALPDRTFAVHPRIRRAHGAATNGNNLRAVKLKDRVLLFAEGLELGEVPGAWPDSVAGMFAGHGACAFDGISVYEIP